MAGYSLPRSYSMPGWTWTWEARFPDTAAALIFGLLASQEPAFGPYQAPPAFLETWTTHTCVPAVCPPANTSMAPFLHCNGLTRVGGAAMIPGKTTAFFVTPTPSATFERGYANTVRPSPSRSTSFQEITTPLSSTFLHQTMDR
ncbi:hypothetical protein C8R46DRAFT_1212507 [Mycena filopes]|nr:hypothetical protein C8R46DRAFT_1212442 [Mycena filopes]KAJ7177777.1 hypothetical protein C8R46DRAFT_1212507 [Mycena filopes]